ncbi:MAG: hypothetical protein WCP97_08515 [bacterium]
MTSTIEKNIMDNISKKTVSMRSKYVFWAQSLGIKSVLLFSFLLALFFLNLVLYSFQVSRAFSFLSFSNTGVLAFLELFPYSWILLVVACVVVFSFVWKRFSVAYKLSIQQVLFALLFLVIGGSIAVAFSGVNQRISQAVEERNVTLLKPFYGNTFYQNGKYHVQGVIERVGEKEFVVKSGNDLVTVRYSDTTHFPDGEDFREGDELYAGGSFGEDAVFYADGIRKQKGMMGNGHGGMMNGRDSR